MKTHIDPLTGPTQLCQISGLLQVSNNEYTLADVTSGSPVESGNSRQKVFGKTVSQEILLAKLNQLGVKDVMLRKSEVQIPGGKIVFNKGRETTIHHSDRNMRSKLISAVKTSLIM